MEDKLEKYWVEVETEKTGRARPAVPEEVPEGGIAEDWILEIDGDRELVSHSELDERVTFEDERCEIEATIPIKKIAEAMNYDPRREYNWVGDEEAEVTLEIDPRTHVVHAIRFDNGECNGITQEALEELGVEF